MSCSRGARLRACAPREEPPQSESFSRDAVAAAHCSHSKAAHSNRDPALPQINNVTNDIKTGMCTDVKQGGRGSGEL